MQISLHSWANMQYDPAGRNVFFYVSSSHLAHLVQTVGQRSEALYMGQSQKAAEEAVEGGLVLPLLLELLSQLKQALPPSSQHPQSQPESKLPPIRALAGRLGTSFTSTAKHHK